MSAQSARIGHAIIGGVLSCTLMIGAAAIAGASAAQTTIVDPNAPKANLSNHDAALDAARRGDYVAAVEFAKKAAAEGHPLDADQVDYMTAKAAKQQASADADAKAKADQAAASATAQQILQRQQKDYAERERRARLAADDAPSAAQLGQQAEALGSFAQETGGAQAQMTPHTSEFKTTANAVNSTTFAENRPSTGSNGRPASNCISFGKGYGASTVVSNKCGFKVVFLWCADGAQGAGACLSDGRLPAVRNEVEAHGQTTLPQQIAGLKVHTWACEAPNVPQASGAEPFECK